MLVAIHQPHFQPWLGYLDRMRQADLFIVLDHVQFERRNYQNRGRIRLDGHEHWLTVPVQQHSQHERILDKQIAYPAPGTSRWWGADHVRTLRHAYRNAPFLDHYIPPFQEILESRREHLIDIDLAMLDFFRKALAIDTPMVRSSELGVSGMKSDLILQLCQAVGADTYLAGMGGSRDYLDRAAFTRAGIEIAWQDFQHPRYAQYDGGDHFIAGLSAIDLLFNMGQHSHRLLIDETLSLPRHVVAAGSPEPSYN
jgi:hypothetical protein